MEHISVLLHDQGGKIEDEAELVSGAPAGRSSPLERTDTPVPASPLSIFGVCLRWIREAASPEECQAIAQACEERQAELHGTQPPPAADAHAAPAPPPVVAPAPQLPVPRAPGARSAPAEFVWRPGPGLSVTVTCRSDDFVE